MQPIDSTRTVNGKIKLTPIDQDRLPQDRSRRLLLRLTGLIKLFDIRVGIPLTQEGINMLPEDWLEQLSSLRPVHMHARLTPDSKNCVRDGLAQLIIESALLREVVGCLILKKQSMHQVDELRPFVARQGFGIRETLQYDMRRLLIGAHFCIPGGDRGCRIVSRS